MQVHPDLSDFWIYIYGEVLQLTVLLSACFGAVAYLSVFKIARSGSGAQLVVHRESLFERFRN